MTGKSLRVRFFSGAIAGLLLLTGCAAPGTLSQRGAARPQPTTPAPSHGEISLWRLDELVQTEQPMVVLQGPRGIHGALETGLLKRIQAIGRSIQRVAGEGPQPELMVLASPGVNAFAFRDRDQAMIALTLGMIRLLEADEDAWAALLGHELAHLRLDHIGGGKDRRERTELASSFAGLVLSAIGLPFANVAADAAATLADRAYSRDDEREADRVGLEYMRRAGFSDQGALRLQQLLLTARSSGPMPFLSTHPSGEERIENLRNLMQSKE